MTEVLEPEPPAMSGAPGALAAHLHLFEPRPRLRGRLHLCAAVFSLAGVVWLVSSARTTEALVAAWVYGLANVLLYGTSGSYHVFAQSPRARRIMQALDHAMIYVLIAGSATPVCVLLLDGAWRWGVLTLMWGGAFTGMLLALTALDRFRKLNFGLYLGLGWAGLLLFPSLLPHPGRLAMVAGAGVLYTVGAILFGLKRPRLDSDWFGYHEVWHTLGVAAGALLFIVNLGIIRSAAV